MPSLLTLSLAEKLSEMVMAPVLVMLPVCDPVARMPVTPSMLLDEIVPALVTLLLLSSVTAAPAALRLIVPPEAMVTSPPVEVATGVDCEPEIVCCAMAG